jgi:ribose transport system ATP-binding protein
LIADLSASERVLVATARALFNLPAGGGFVFVDEPTAALDEAEAEALLGHLQGLTAGGEVGICFISHRLREILRYADRATVLRDGRVALEAAAGEINEQSLIVALGGQEAARRQHRAATGDDVVEYPMVTIEDVACGRLRGVTLTVARGEIVGVTGLEGSGKADLVALLYGMAQPRQGRILVDGEAVHLRNEHDALRLGFGLVPGNRISLGGIGEFSSGENLQLPRYRQFSVATWYNQRAADRDATLGLERFGVSPRDPKRVFGTLSGGNQQKVIVGRWLSFPRRFLILHEPTAGVDVAARAALYAQVRAAAHEGLAIVVITSDPLEVTELCDRAVVLVDGAVAGTFIGAEMTVSRLVGESFTTIVADGSPEAAV